MSRITLTQTALADAPALGSTSLFVKPDQELYLKLDTGQEKKVGGVSGSTDPFLPTPEVHILNATSYPLGGDQRNSHDQLCCLLPPGFDERFYDYAPELWLYRYVKRHKNSRLTKKWVHPTHLNGEANADGSPRMRTFFDGGAHNLNYKSVAAPGQLATLVRFPMPPRTTEWVLPAGQRLSGAVVKLPMEPHLWFDHVVQDGLGASQPVMAPASFGLGDFSLTAPLHELRPTGRSKRETAGRPRTRAQLFALRIMIRNPSEDADELARRPRLFSALSLPFRLRILSANPGNGNYISYRYML